MATFFSRVTFSLHRIQYRHCYFTHALLLCLNQLFCAFPKISVYHENFRLFFLFSSPFALLIFFFTDVSSFPYYTKSDVIFDYYIRNLHVHARNFVLFVTEYMWIGFGQLLYYRIHWYHFPIIHWYSHLLS